MMPEQQTEDANKVRVTLDNILDFRECELGDITFSTLISAVDLIEAISQTVKSNPVNVVVHGITNRVLVRWGLLSTRDYDFGTELSLEVTENDTRHDGIRFGILPGGGAGSVILPDFKKSTLTRFIEYEVLIDPREALVKTRTPYLEEHWWRCP